MKNIARRTIALGCVGLLLVGMSGCDKTIEKKDKIVLRVITDPSIQKEVNSIADTNYGRKRGRCLFAGYESRCSRDENGTI